MAVPDLSQWGAFAPIIRIPPTPPPPTRAEGATLRRGSGETLATVGTGGFPYAIALQQRGVGRRIVPPLVAVPSGGILCGVAGKRMVSMQYLPSPRCGAGMGVGLGGC